MDLGLMVSKASRKVFFLFHFSNPSHVEAILFHGLWTVRSSLLVFQRWSRDFSISDDRKLWVLVWVEFPSLPLRCWSFMQTIARFVGKVVCLEPDRFFMLALKRGFVLRSTFLRTWKKLLIFKWVVTPSPRRWFIWTFPTLVIDVSRRITRSGIVPWQLRNWNPLLRSLALVQWREPRRMNGPLWFVKEKPLRFRPKRLPSVPILNQRQILLCSLCPPRRLSL